MYFYIYNLICLLIVCEIFLEVEPNKAPNSLISKMIHDTLDNIEIMIKKGSFNGSIKLFFSIIEECASSRPESSVLHLISYLSNSIIPTQHLWLTNLYNLLHKYFKPDVRTNIRLKVLDILSNIVKLHR